MPTSCVKVAHGILLHGQIPDGSIERQQLLKKINVGNTSFRDAGKELGAKTGEGGLRFFDSTTRSHIRLGPGAGLVVGVSVGTSSLRACLVDANGVLRHTHTSPPVPDQLALSSRELLDRIRDAAAVVLRSGLDDADLLVDGALPFLGLVVGWATPVDREKRPKGPALRDRGWHNGVPLNQRVAEHLHIDHERSHALNDAHAAAIAVAWTQTRSDKHVTQSHPRMAIVMRLAGAISGASIIVEPPEMTDYGQVSGFAKSILMGGADMHAGELGHVPLDSEIIAELNENRPIGLGELTPCRCSCTEPSERMPKHLEAYAGAQALAYRIAPDEPQCDVVGKIRAAPAMKVHQRALEDVGVLVGHALLGPVAMLNPATITLTGSLATETVRRAIAEHVSESLPFGGSPEVRLLAPDVNPFIRAQGAALAVLRGKVYRKLDELVGGPKSRVSEPVRLLTEPLTALPWEPS